MSIWEGGITYGMGEDMLWLHVVCNMGVLCVSMLSLVHTELGLKRLYHFSCRLQLLGIIDVNLCIVFSLMTEKFSSTETLVFSKLDKVMNSTRTLNDVAKLSPHLQTSSLEAFHSVILRFAPKNVVFPYIGMLCRWDVWPCSSCVFYFIFDWPQ